MRKPEISPCGEHYDVVLPYPPFDEQALTELILGPTPYDGVAMLNDAADYCSDKALSASTVNEQDCTDWAAACLLLEDKADELDRELVAQFSLEAQRG